MGSETWQTLVLTPGSDPFRALAEQVATLDASENSDRLATVDALTARFAEQRDGLRTAIGALTADNRRPVVIVVDQFEEVFTSVPSEGSRATVAQVVAILSDTVADPSSQCRVLVTLRADFMAQALAVPGLGELLEDGEILLGAMSPEALREVIVKPAQLVGALFEKGVVRAVLDDVSDEPGGLPLLQHALLELWRQRRGPWLTLDAYDESGGVLGALPQRAQATYDDLSPERQELTRMVFLRLTTFGEGVSDTRRRVDRAELYPAGVDPGEVDLVLHALSDQNARLLVADSATVEVAHEALLQRWDTLRGWLDENREALRIHRRLTLATNDWMGLGQDPGSLYRGAKLAEAEEWATSHNGQLTSNEEAFLGTSRKTRAGKKSDAFRTGLSPLSPLL